MGFCAAIACGSQILVGEAHTLIELFESSETLRADPICRAIYAEAVDALSDGMVSDTQSKSICDVIANLVGDSFSDTGITALGNTPVMPTVSLCSLNELEGKTLVLTGKFRISPRRIIEDALHKLGASSKATPCKKTDFVLIASESSRDWVYTHKGTKLIKALKLHEEGGKLAFLDEVPLMKLLNL